MGTIISKLLRNSAKGEECTLQNLMIYPQDLGVVRATQPLTEIGTERQATNTPK